MVRKTLIIIIVTISLLATLFLISRPLIFVKKATGDISTFQNNSYLFASPLEAKADNQEIIRLTVFILDNRGLGIANQQVSLKSKPNLQIIPISPITDQLGKAIFDLKTNISGKYQLSASLNNATLSQVVNVVFN